MIGIKRKKILLFIPTIVAFFICTIIYFLVRNGNKKDTIDITPPAGYTAVSSEAINAELTEFLNIFTAYPQLSVFNQDTLTDADIFTAYYTADCLGLTSQGDETIYPLEDYIRTFSKLFYSEKELVSAYLYGRESDRIRIEGGLSYHKNGSLTIKALYSLDNRYYIVCEAVDQDLSAYEAALKSIKPGDGWTGGIVLGTVAAEVIDTGNSTAHEWKLYSFQNTEPEVVRKLRSIAGAEK